jgi:hypothetical protein
MGLAFTIASVAPWATCRFAGPVVVDPKDVSLA